MKTQSCLESKPKHGLITKTQLLLLLHVFVPRAKAEHCCSRTPVCRAGISSFRRKQTGNKKAHLLHKDMAFSSKKIEALVVLKPAHGPTPRHCFWKSDPFFSALRIDSLWVETRNGEDKIVSGWGVSVSGMSKQGKFLRRCVGFARFNPFYSSKPWLNESWLEMWANISAW